MGNLFLILMHPLPANHHSDTAFFVDIADAGFGLKISVFLYRCMVFALDNDIGIFKSVFEVAFADLVMAENVRFALRVQEDGIGLFCFAWVINPRQVFILDGDQTQRLSGDVFSFCNDECYVIAHKAHVIGIGL